MITILGAGLAGLACAYRLRQNKKEFIIYEKETTYGGLCQKIQIGEFFFDRFVHLSFTQDEEIQKMFSDSAESIILHQPKAFNYYHQKWLAHPAQNNLYPLDKKEQKIILDGFKNRDFTLDPKNYQEWLNSTYGEAFAERFPNSYTRKYWTVSPELLETKWVGTRVLQSDLSEIEEGISRNTPSTKFYTKEMKYPEKGAYQAFIDQWAEKEHIRFNHDLVKLDIHEKKLYYKNGTITPYSTIVSTLPLPYMISIMTNVPQNVITASKKLKATKGYTVSIGLQGQIKTPSLWFYVYDEDILFARVYSPSIKSPNNAPEGCSSLQAEIYYSDFKKLNISEELLAEHTIDKLVHMNIIDKSQVLFAKINQFDYANVIFTHHIYDSRKIVRDYLLSQNIYTAGRFGEWGYLWSDQAVRSGLNIAEYLSLKET